MTGPVTVDLHVHSALSPCGADEMRPPAVLLTAEQRGIAAVGLVDHNSAGNARAFAKAAEAFDVRVLVGLELESAEGVHVVALFDSADAALDLQAALAGHRLLLPSQPQRWGRQLLVDAQGDVIGEEPWLLSGGCDLPLDRLAAMTIERGGLSIAAHVDRTAWGLLPTLGFVPPDLPVDLLEISPRITPAQARERWPELVAWPLLSSSDAHTLPDVGRAPTQVSALWPRRPGGLREWAGRLAEELMGREA